MGGIGSGRKCRNSLTTELYRLNVRRLQRLHLLEPNRTGKLHLHRIGGCNALVWTLFQNGQLHADLDTGLDLFGLRRTRLKIEIAWSACPYGGSRAWFVCPGAGCGRHAVILYGKEDLLCRRCRIVTYPMQRVHPRSRALARAQQVRVRLGGDPDVTRPFPPRPKGMHGWTYTKLGIKGLVAEKAANKAVIDLFGPSKSGSTRSASNDLNPSLFVPGPYPNGPMTGKNPLKRNLRLDLEEFRLNYSQERGRTDE